MRYALVVVHARKEKEESNHKHDVITINQTISYVHVKSAYLFYCNWHLEKLVLPIATRYTIHIK